MGGDAVVNGSDGFIGAAHFEATLTEASEGLRRGDFVNQVQVNIQHGGRVGLLRDDVVVPDFLEEGKGRGHEGELGVRVYARILVR